MRETDRHPAIQIPRAVTEVDELLVTDAADAGPVVTSNPTPAAARPKKTIMTLFVWAEDANEANSIGNIRRYRSYRFPKSTGVRAQSWNELVQVLGQYDAIDFLILFAHGLPGSLSIGGTFKDTAELAALFKPINTKVRKKIIFEGCEFLKFPGDVVQVGQSLSSPWVEGYTWAHYLRQDRFDIPANPPPNPPQSTVQAFQDIRPFLVPRYDGVHYNQPATLSALMANRGRRVHLLYEWFRESYTSVFQRQAGDEPRSSLVTKKLKSKAEIDAFDRDALGADPLFTPAYRLIVRC